MEFYDRRSDQENYKGYLLVANAGQPVKGAHWTLTVEVQQPDKKWLPPIHISDRSFPTADGAVAAGMALARQLVDGRY